MAQGGESKDEDWDNTTLGTLPIDDSRLVVEVNSARRRRRIEKEIAKRLGSAATLVDTTVADIAEALEQRAQSASASAAIVPPHDAAPASPELQAIEAELAHSRSSSPRST